MTNRCIDRDNALLPSIPLGKFFLFCCGFLLAGCQPHSALKDDLQEYGQRLANVLDLEPAAAQEIPYLEYPPVSQLKVTIPEVTINLRDFYALHDCPVATLIAERNTALGRTQLPSTRYLYEVKLLQGLQDCLARVEEPEMKKQLNIWLKQKQELLPLAWVNLLQLSGEIKHAFSFNQGLLRGNDSDNAYASLASLAYLLSLQDKPVSEQVVLETHLQQLKKANFPARIWRSQRLLSAELHSITQWLADNRAEIQCDSPANQQRVGYLNNVFTLYFIDKIQPVAGKLNQYQYQLIPLLQKIQTSPHTASQLKALLRQYEQEFEQYKAAMSAHVNLWQEVLASCNLSPKVDP